jgi:hypothetical protein
MLSGTLLLCLEAQPRSAQWRMKGSHQRNEKKSRDRPGDAAEATEVILKNRSDKLTYMFSSCNLLPYISFDIPVI